MFSIKTATKRAGLCLPFIIVLFVALDISFVNAQIRFNKIYTLVHYTNGLPGYTSFTNLKALNDGYILTCSVPDTTGTCSCNTRLFLFVDSTGQVIKKNIKLNGIDNIYIYTMPKNLVFSKTKYYTLSAYIDKNNFLGYLLLNKINTTLGIEYERSIDDIIYSEFNGGKMYKLSDSKLSITTSGNTVPNTTQQNAYYYLIDTLGNVINIKQYKTPNFFELTPTLTIAETNKLILFNSILEPFGPIKYRSRIQARRIDTLGNFLGYFYQGSFADSLYGVEDVIKTQDGGYLIATQRYTYSPSLDFQYTNGAFLKLSQNGTKQWLYYPGKFQFNADSSSAIFMSNNAIELPSKELIISGTYHYFVEDGDTTTLPELRTPVYYWFISKLSPDGKLIWNRLFNYIKPNNNRMFYLDNLDLDTCPDKGYILSGYLTDIVNELSSGWLVKVDSFGCLLPGCHLSPKEESTDSTVQVLLYPNPADQFINFMPQFFGSNVQYRLVDMLGHSVVNGTVPDGSTNMIDSRDLPSGMYILDVRNDKYRISKKVVVQR